MTSWNMSKILAASLMFSLVACGRAPVKSDPGHDTVSPSPGLCSEGFAAASCMVGLAGVIPGGIAVGTLSSAAAGIAGCLCDAGSLDSTAINNCLAQAGQPLNVLGSISSYVGCVQAILGPVITVYGPQPGPSFPPEPLPSYQGPMNVPTGQPCMGNADCAGGADCQSIALCGGGFGQVCVGGGTLPSGSGCNSSEDCGGGQCTNCVCGPPVPYGSGCHTDSDCVSGDCNVSTGTCTVPATIPTVACGSSDRSGDCTRACASNSAANCVQQCIASTASICSSPSPTPTASPSVSP